MLRDVSSYFCNCNAVQNLNCRNLNFSTATCSEDDSEYGPYKKNKVTRVGDSFLPFILTKSKPRFDIAARSNVP